MASKGQEVIVVANNIPLNKVLISIIESHNVSISFDDSNLSNYKITDSTEYPSLNQALAGLLVNLPLSYELIGDVWVIYPRKELIYHPQKAFVSGRVLDEITNEALPYSHVIVNGWPTVTDLKGSFSSSFLLIDSIINIKVTHLGYYILDTIVKVNQNHNFPLIPSSIGLSEIIISGNAIERSTQIGDLAGLMKLNHKIAHFLPGYGDNSVFNLIRLMPGILASGEQTSELIIWGSYAGQSKVLFDGFTVYGLKNFNDNISAFNPLMVKDIEIHKGGYDASFGGRIGGIVNIIGKNGNTKSPSFTFSVNNMTINGMVEIPILKRGSLVVAFRHTYYKLYNPADMTAVVRQNNDADTTNDLDITVIPAYMFRDINLKYSTTMSNGNLFYISLRGGGDNFSYSINEPIKQRVIDKNTQEENTQLGGAIFYGHNWKRGNYSNFRMSYSGLNALYKDDFKIRIPINNNIEYIANDRNKNSLEEYTFEFSNSIALNQIHTLEGGMDVIHNIVKLDEYSFNALTARIYSSANRISLYAQDNISVTKNFSIIAGVRLNYAFNLQKSYFEPRLSSSLKLGKYWKINAALGIYNQFITLSSAVDEYGNYRYLWVISNNDEIPVLEATHYVLGTSYHQNNFTFSLEGYYKSTTGLTRYVNFPKYNLQDIFIGEAESYGIDLLIKKDILQHSAWIAYSLSKTTEYFKYYQINNTRRAPQDQRHELKLAGLLNFNPFFFSSNYVFGSGFPYGNGITQNNDNSDLIYSRLDISVIYKFLDKKVQGEVGISVLNVLNTKNVKYSSFEKIPTNQTSSINIFAGAIPTTPTLYLKISM